MNRRKHILLLASRPLANDGITKMEMDAIDFNKDIITFDVACAFGFDNSYGEKLKKEGIKCFELSPKKNVFLYIKSIRKLVRAQKYDAVYIHGNSAMMFFDSLPAKMAGAKVITHCHNTKSDYPIIHYLLKPFFNVLIDKKIGCSSLASKWAYCGKNIKTIVNGVDIDKFKFDETIRTDMRAKIGWANQKIVGHIGRFNYQKNHEKLIRIFKKMYDQDTSCRLLLIGDGELQQQIKEQIASLKLENVVKIIDHTDSPQEYMNAMDIMIMPSLFEGLCLVAIEAQANGLPILLNRFFSPETSATKQARVLDLEDLDDVWAGTALNMISAGRQNVTQQLKNKNMDYTDMMNSIRNELIE